MTSTKHQTSTNPRKTYTGPTGDEALQVTLNVAEREIEFVATTGPCSSAIVGLNISTARQLAHDLLAVAATMELAEPGALDAIEKVAASRGITMKELAAVAKVNLDSVTVAQAGDLMVTLVRWDEALPEHLLDVLASA